MDWSSCVCSSYLFTLDTALDAHAGDASVVGCAYTELPQDVAPGDVLLLNDGAITMRVDEVAGTRVHCTVLIGGALSNRKGINKQGGGLSAAALTAKAQADIRIAVAPDVDFIAVSFPRNATHVHEAPGAGQRTGS